MMKSKNQTINYLRIAIGEDLIARVTDDKIIKVLGENKDRIVLDDEYFTALDKEKVRRCGYQRNPYIGELRISDYTKDTFFRKHWGNFVIYIYHNSSSRKVLQNKINREFQKYIDSKIGRYCAIGQCKIVL